MYSFQPNPLSEEMRMHGLEQFVLNSTGQIVGQRQFRVTNGDNGAMADLYFLSDRLPFDPQFGTVEHIFLGVLRGNNQYAPDFLDKVAELMSREPILVTQGYRRPLQFDWKYLDDIRISTAAAGLYPLIYRNAAYGNIIRES